MGEEKWIIELVQVDSHVHFLVRNRSSGLCHSSHDSELCMRHGDFIDFWQALGAGLVVSETVRHIGPIYGRDSEWTRIALAMYGIEETPPRTTATEEAPE